MFHIPTLDQAASDAIRQARQAIRDSRAPTAVRQQARIALSQTRSFVVSGRYFERSARDYLARSHPMAWPCAGKAAEDLCTAYKMALHVIALAETPPARRKKA